MADVAVALEHVGLELRAFAVKRVLLGFAEEAEETARRQHAMNLAKNGPGDAVGKVVEREPGVDGVEGMVPEGKRPRDVQQLEPQVGGSSGRDRLAVMAASEKSVARTVWPSDAK